MKVVTVEVDITVPERMNGETVVNAFDHMLDAGAAIMAAEVSSDAMPPVICPAVAEDCVRMDVGDAQLVDGYVPRRDPLIVVH